MTVSLRPIPSMGFASKWSKLLSRARFMAFVLLACTLSISHGPSLRGQERSLDLDVPTVVFLGKDSSRFWEVPDMPLPSLIAQGAKEEPKVDFKVLERFEKEQKATLPTEKTPGCAYSTAVTTSLARVIQGARADYKQGMRRYLSGDFKESIESLSRVVSGVPGTELSGYSTYYIGESFYHLGRPDEALIHFSQLVEEHPDHQLLDWAHYSIGWIYLEKEDFQMALSRFQQIARSQGESPLVPTALFWEGETLGRSGQIEEAIVSKRLFLERYPTHSRAPQVQLSIGGYLLRLRRLGQAAQVYREFAMSYPKDPRVVEALNGLGQSLIYDEQYREGISILKDGLQRFPDTPLAGSMLLGLVRGYLGIGQSDRALETYEEVVDRFPQYEWSDNALFDIGYYYFENGEYARSVELYQDLLRVHPGSELKPLVYFNLGESLYNLGLYKEAIDSYRLAEEMARRDSILEEAVFKMGLAFYHTKRYTRAIESWERLLRDFPESVRRDETLYWTGEAFLRNRNPERAAAHFKDLEENVEIYPRVLNSLGLYYFSEGQWNQAIQHFMTLLDRYPYHPIASEAYLRLAEAFYNRRDYPKALFYLEELVNREDAPSLDRAFFVQGRIFYKEGKFEVAVDRFSDVLGQFPESTLAAESQYWIAWSYYRMGKYENAIEEFTKVMQNPPSTSHASQAVLRVGDCYYNLGSYLEATLTYLQVVREFPQSREVPEAEYGILLAYERQGRYENFVERAKTFLSKYPTHPLGANILSRLAQHYLDRNMVDQGIASYRELIQNYPRNDLADGAQFKLGEIYREQQDFQNAILEFGLVVKHYPRSNYLVDAYFEIAQSYFALEDYRRALEGYERVARRFPQNHLAGKAFLKTVDCLERLGSMNLAEKRLAELMEVYPDDAIRSHGALKLGLILSRTSRYAEAIEVLREATKSRDPEVASLAQVEIGLTYQKMGDSSSAIVELMKAVYLYPGQTRPVEKALLQVGEIYMAQKKWESAQQIFLRVIEVSQSESVRNKARNFLTEINRSIGNE